MLEDPLPAGIAGEKLSENFQRLRESVFKKRPVLEEIIRKQGHKTLHRYAEDYFDVNKGYGFIERRNQFMIIFRNHITRLLGEDIAKSAVNQLKKYYFVSTSDHHGPLTHPFFVNSNLLASLPYFDHTDHLLQNIIVLSCSNVSLNNSSFPRGLLFNSYAKGKMQMHRLSFLPSNAHSSTVYGFRPYTKEEVSKVRLALKEKVKNGDVHNAEAEKLNALIDEIYDRPEIFGCKSFSDQMVKTNYKLWQKFFKSSIGAPPNLIYVEQESLVIDLLITHHLHQDTVVNHILFDSHYDDLIKKYFEGIMGTFSLAEGWGTYLFWGVSNEKNYRVSLFKQDNKLVSKDGSFVLELTPESLKEALETKQIIPSMMMIFIVISFYYGLKCLGGFNQVNYLTLMKNAYLRAMVDRGNYRSIEICARAQTKEIGDGLTIAFLGGPNGELIPATGIDLYLYGTDETWTKIVQESKIVTLEEALNPLMPEFYKIIYPDTERQSALLEITSENITKITGLDKKIEPCANIGAYNNVCDVGTRFPSRLDRSDCTDLAAAGTPAKTA